MTVKRIGFIFLLFLLCRCTTPVQIGQKAPDFLLTDLKGNSVSLADLKGRVVFLHFWATWCPPCLVELPQLIRFYKEFNPDKVKLLTVCVDNSNPDKIKSFVSSGKYNMPVYLDPGGNLAQKYGTVRFPETYILDTGGIVRKKIIGAGEWDMSFWARFLQDLLPGSINKLPEKPVEKKFPK